MFFGKKLSKKPIINRYFVSGMLISMSISGMSVGVNAQEILTLNDAISLSLQQHPELHVFTHKSEAAKALITQAEVGTPKVVNAQLEDFLGSGNNSGVSGLQATLSISWLLENDIIESRVNLASSKADATSIDQEVRAVDIAANTAQLYITLLAQKENLKLAKIAEDQAKDLLDNVEGRVKAAKANAIDELRARASLSLYELEVEDLVHEIAATKSALAAQWKGTTNFSVTGTLTNIPSISELDEVLKRLKENPKIQRYILQQQEIESEIDLAVVEESPAWEVSTGIRRNEVIDDFAFVAGISIPIGGEGRNKGLITSLRAKQSQSAAESDALLQSISTDALLLTHKLKHSLHVIQKLSNSSIPMLEQANEQASRAYNIGSYSYTDLFAVQKELLNAQKSLIDAYTNIQLFNIELERLTGTSVSKNERAL
tara:strand:- start:2124 stop:3413 length:1290 start_codon:yes stop_codon:yes gene_type:complete